MVTHVWVAEQAAERQAPGPLRDIVTDPTLLPALRNGAIYQDSGYSVRAEYGEWAHWESFIEPYARWIRGRWGAEMYRSPDARRHVAFLMGLAAHSMTDQTFDQYFMARAEQYDRSIDQLDVGSDAWLIVEHGVSSAADGQFWFDEMPSVHVAVGGPAVTPDLLRRASNLTAGATQFLARYGWSLYPMHWRAMPWSASHYWDRGTPGSYPHLVEVTAAYQAFLWQRLLGTAPDDAAPLYSWPAPAQTNYPVARADIESRVVITTPWGLDDATVNTTTVRVVTEAGVAVPVRVSRYGDHGNTVMVRAEADYAFNTAYRVELDARIRTLAGRAIGRTLTIPFRTQCAPDRLSECPPLVAPLPTLAEPPVRDPRPPPGGTPPGPVVMVDDGGLMGSDAGGDATADASVAPGGEGEGCGCRARGGSGGGGWMALVVAAIARRRAKRDVSRRRSGRSPAR